VFLKIFAAKDKKKHQSQQIEIVDYVPKKHNSYILSALEKEPLERIIHRYHCPQQPSNIISNLGCKPIQVFILWDKTKKDVAGWGELYYKNIFQYEMCIFIAKPYEGRTLALKLGLKMIDTGHEKFKIDVYGTVGLDNPGSLKLNEFFGKYRNSTVIDRVGGTGIPYKEFIYHRE